MGNLPSQQIKTNAIIGTAVSTAVGAALLGTGIGLTVRDKNKNKNNDLSPEAIALLAVGSLITVGGGVAVTVVSLAQVDEHASGDPPNKYIYVLGTFSSNTTSDTDNLLINSADASTSTTGISTNTRKFAYAGVSGSINTYLACYKTSDGTCTWATTITNNATGANLPVNILIDSTGLNLYVLGKYFSSTTTSTDDSDNLFINSADASTSTTGISANTRKFAYAGVGAGSAPNTYLASYKTLDGTCTWATTITNSISGANIPVNILLDSKGENLYVLGKYFSTTATTTDNNNLRINSADKTTSTTGISANTRTFAYAGPSGSSNTYLACYKTSDGTCTWATTITNSISGFNFPLNILIDSTGLNLYVLGQYFSTTITTTDDSDNLRINSADKTTSTTGISTNTRIFAYAGVGSGSNTYLASYKTLDGTCAWATTITNSITGFNVPLNILIDSTGLNLYVFGKYFSSTTNSNDDTDNLLINSADKTTSTTGISANIRKFAYAGVGGSGGANTYLACYKTLDGTCTWATTITNKVTGYNFPLNILIDSTGLNLYVFGKYFSSTTNSNDDTDNLLINSADKTTPTTGISANTRKFAYAGFGGGSAPNTYLASYKTLDGTCSWATTITNSITGFNESINILIDSTGLNLYVFGKYFSKTATGTDNNNLLVNSALTQLQQTNGISANTRNFAYAGFGTGGVSGSVPNTYLACYKTSDGTCTWATTITNNATGFNEPVNILIDSTGLNLYLLGQYSSTATTASGTNDINNLVINSASENQLNNQTSGVLATANRKFAYRGRGGATDRPNTYLACYNTSNGVSIWATTITNNSTDTNSPVNILFDSTGSKLYILGKYFSTTTDRTATDNLVINSADKITETTSISANTRTFAYAGVGGVGNLNTYIASYNVSDGVSAWATTITNSISGTNTPFEISL